MRLHGDLRDQMRALIRNHRIVMAEARRTAAEAEEVAEETRRIIALYREFGERTSLGSPRRG